MAKKKESKCPEGYEWDEKREVCVEEKDWFFSARKRDAYLFVFTAIIISGLVSILIATVIQQPLLDAIEQYSIPLWIKVTVLLVILFFLSALEFHFWRRAGAKYRM